MVRRLVVDGEYLRQIEERRTDLHYLLSSDKEMAPIVLRLAFHDAGTYDKKSNTGGPNGSIRNCDFTKIPHKGLEVAINFLVQVTGGPLIEFVPGRTDVQNQVDQGSIATPNGDAAHLRSIFINQMGLSDKDIVVLSGAHALGRAHMDTSGFEGPFTRDPLKFDNSYFIELLRGDTPGLVKFPSDKVLLQDETFYPLVQLYAKDKEALFKDYAKSHKKFSELGFHPDLHAEAQHPPAEAKPPVAKL